MGRQAWIKKSTSVLFYGMATGMRILIADDELASRSKLHKIMSRFGYCKAVDSGESVQITISILKAVSPSVCTE